MVLVNLNQTPLFRLKNATFESSRFAVSFQGVSRSFFTLR